MKNDVTTNTYIFFITSSEEETGKKLMNDVYKKAKRLKITLNSLSLLTPSKTKL